MTTFALIGIKLSILESDFEQQKKATCSHDFLDDMDDDVMFCPKCGSRVTVADGKLRQFDDAYDFSEHLEKQIAKTYNAGPNWMVLNGYDEFEDDEIEEENGVMFVGVGVSTENDYDMIEAPMMDQVRHTLQDVLGPYDLYDAQNIGLWVVDMYA